VKNAGKVLKLPDPLKIVISQLIACIVNPNKQRGPFPPSLLTVKQEQLQKHSRIVRIALEKIVHVVDNV